MLTRFMDGRTIPPEVISARAGARVHVARRIVSAIQ